MEVEMSVERAENRPVPPRPRAWRPYILAIVSAIFLSGGLFAVSRLLRRPKAPAAPALAASRVKAVPPGETGKVGDLVITEEALQLAEIKIAPALERTISEKLVVSGNIETGGDRLVKVTPRVAGKIVSLSAVAGDAVRAGQTLGMIESHELARAQADYRQACARMEAARLNLDRQQKLARLGTFGQPKVEEARRAALAAQEEVRTAESDVTAARAKIVEAESDLRALQAALSQAQAQERVLESRLKRAERLLREQIISRQEWEQTQADYQRALSDVEVARAKAAQGEARIETAKAQLNAAQTRLEAAQKRAAIETQALTREEQVYQGRFNTSKELVEAETALRQAQLDRRAAAQTVRLLGGTPGGGSLVPLVTPIAGRILERSATLGETVDTQHTLFTIINLDVVWAQLAVSPRDLPYIRTGQRVALTAETAPGRTFTGIVSAIGNTAEATTRAVRLRVILPNRGDLLKPGAFVRGYIVTDVRRACLTVPEGALQEHNGRPTVYVAKEGQKTAFDVRHVKPGIRGPGWREIEYGLFPGERIAVSGTFYLKSEALKSALSDGCCAVPGGE